MTCGDDDQRPESWIEFGLKSAFPQPAGAGLSSLPVRPELRTRTTGPCDTKAFTTVANRMSYTKPTDQTAGVVAALVELDVRPAERVLIMPPDGPGFAEAFAATIQQGAVPLPVNPLLPVPDIVAVAAEAGARLVLASADQIHALADLDTEPPVLIDGPQGLWAAALRLRLSEESPRH
jgi:acyl-CoA synthetase (AMP-forming)/AMP-acid ligase II